MAKYLSRACCDVLAVMHLCCASLNAMQGFGLLRDFRSHNPWTTAQNHTTAASNVQQESLLPAYILRWLRFRLSSFCAGSLIRAIITQVGCCDRVFSPVPHPRNRPILFGCYSLYAKRNATLTTVSIKVPVSTVICMV